MGLIQRPSFQPFRYILSESCGRSQRVQHEQLLLCSKLLQGPWRALGGGPTIATHTHLQVTTQVTTAEEEVARYWQKDLRS
jgi:hypothetical protein